MYLSIGALGVVLGVAVVGDLAAVGPGRAAGSCLFRTVDGHRRYRLASALAFLGAIGGDEERDSRLTVAYARVSSHDQKNDLARQVARLGDPRFFPSSKTCHKCKVKSQDLTLSDRIFTCVNPACGNTCDWDPNAAINIQHICMSTIPRAAGKFTPMETWSIPPLPHKGKGGKPRVGSGGKGLSGDSAQACKPGSFL